MLKLPPSSLQLTLGDAELDMPHQLLHRAGVTSHSRLTARSVGPTAGRSRDTEVGIEGGGRAAGWLVVIDISRLCRRMTDREM